jgi:hypothetical protein
MPSMFDYKTLIKSNLTNPEILNKAIEYLTKLSKDIPTFFKDSNANDAFQCIVYIVSKYEFDFQIFESKGFEIFMVNLMSYLFQIRNDLNFDTNAKIKDSELNNKHILTFTNSMYLQNLIFRRSKKVY